MKIFHFNNNISLIKYADPLLDLIDPQRVFSTRLFREHCKSGYSHGSVKDLSTLGRDMRNVIYVDDEREFILINIFDCDMQQINK